MERTQELIERVRSAWRFRGHQRPPFAIDPEPGQESVWDYPRPPSIEPEHRLVEVRIGDILLGSSREALRVCETGSPPTVYLPPSDIDMTHLKLSSTRSFCEWKGEARYLQLVGCAAAGTDVAWYYPTPFAGAEAIASWVSFYPGRVDCYLAGELARAQMGGFYGGWITREIVGPFKGAPGTQDW